MKNIKFSVNSWVFGKIPFAELARRAKEIGLDGLEVDGEPDKLSVQEMKAILKANGLLPISVCGTFSTPDRAFNHSDSTMRNSAIAYGKKLVDMAYELETDRLLIVPSQVDKLTPYLSKEQDWENSVEAIRTVSEYAKEKGNIKIMLECVNKYEVSMVFTLEDGIRMAKQIGTGNIGLVGDTFHMQLEEASGIPSAIRSAEDQWLMHLHLGDNNREVPGKGCRNWREIFQALQDIDFSGAASFEPLPRRLTPGEIGAGLLNPDELQEEMTVSIQMLKGIMTGIQ